MIAILYSSLILAAAAAPSAGAAEAGLATTPAKAVASKPADGSKVICWEERPTGSHVAKKVCATQEQLDEAKRDADDAVTARDPTRPPKNFGPAR